VASAQHSIVINMYGYADTDINDIILGKLATAHGYVQMSLDKTQAPGVHEKPLPGEMGQRGFGNSIAIGSSSDLCDLAPQGRSRFVTGRHSGRGH
jgi:hypothetical protein